MVRRKFLVLILLTAFSLLVGCTNGENTYESWIDFSYFQERFDRMPDGIAHEPWQTNQLADSNTIHSTVLWCNDQSRQTLEITTNSSGNILNITLQSRKEECCISCFADASYHMFGSMGFNDKDGKGNIVFSGSGEIFEDYFQFFSDTDVKESMWINGHEVSYTYLHEDETHCFTIHYNIKSNSDVK
jgi:hypothetical protein